ncbi:MAG: DMT family transporter [Pseudomonadota bacterium]
MTETQRGAAWIVLGMALVALSDIFLLGISGDVGLWQFQAMRAAMVLPVCLVGLSLTVGIGVAAAKSLRRVAERSALVTLALLLYFAALPAIPLAQAAAGLFTSPIWIILFTAMAERRFVGPRRLLSVMIGFGGVCLVLGVGAEPLRPMAAVAIASGAAYGAGVIWTRRHCAGETAIALSVWLFGAFFCAGLVGMLATPLLQGLIGNVGGTEFATRGPVPVTVNTLAMVFLIGSLALSASACLAQGYRSAEPTIVGLFDYSFLFWISLWSLVLFGEAPSVREIAGMTLIVAAGGLALWSDRYRAAASNPS